MSFAERRHIGYDTSIYRNPTTGQQRIILDMANATQGLDDLEVQLVLHMTGKVAGRGSTIRLLKVANQQVANFYGAGGEKYKAPPGMKPGDQDFGIICKDGWDVPHLQDLSEGMIIQLLHVKGVRGVIWCLDEKPVLAPDAPSLPDSTSQGSLIMDNTVYTRSRWGIRALGLPHTALNALFKKEEKIMNLPQLPSLSTDSTQSSAAPTQSSIVPSPTSCRPMVLEDHHTTRCHVRSYLYPVGTPIYWFGNILELLCVLRDLVRTHQEACSVSTDERKKSFAILHRDLSLWNFAMVSQARSDWPVDREWRSSKLKDCWEEVPEDIRSKIRRGLLIDWGFATIQGTNEVELTEEDVMVYPPVPSDSSWLMMWDVTFNEGEVGRHESPGVCSSPEQNKGILPVPPLWIYNDEGKLEVNHDTNVYLSKAANEGQLDHGWVNDALRKQEAVSTTATVSGDFEQESDWHNLDEQGTSPFLSFEVMQAWLLSQKVAIQPWHDLETIFMSFTALCLWFRTPLHAKNVDHGSEIAWIFQSYSETDNESFMSMYSKWEMFGPLFRQKILGNLSPYFNCPAITVLLTEMRDLCIPHSWGNGEERTPVGYMWPDDQPRITHSKMLDAIEKAILTLVQDMDHSSNIDPVLTFDSLENPPKTWDDFHAKINSDGIFLPAAAAMAATASLPVVVDGYNHTLSQVKQGLYYRVNPIGIDTRVEEVASTSAIDRVLTATRSSAYAGKEEFCDHLFKNLAKPRKRADPTTDDMVNRFTTSHNRLKRRRNDPS